MSADLADDELPDLFDEEMRRQAVIDAIAGHFQSVNIVNVTKPKLPPEVERELHQLAQRARVAVGRRDASIRHWHSKGYTLRDIATATGTITHSGVNRIVKRS